MNTSKLRSRALLATTSVAALMAAGAAPLHAACVVVTGAGVGYTNPVATTIDCLDVNSAALTSDVVNDGTISSLDPVDGIAVTVNSTILGAIINTGVISAASANAIYLAVTSTSLDGVTNTGQINAIQGIQISSSSFSGGITNSGTISTADAAIDVDAVFFSGGISNSGMITAGSFSLNSSEFSTFTGGITNTGTITGGAYTSLWLRGANFSGGIVNAGLMAASSNGMVVNDVSTFSGGIVNTGQIQAAAAKGIDVVTVGLFTGGINNSGTIAAFTTGISLNTVSNFSGGISNSGTLTSGSTSIRLTTMSLFSGGIVNTGQIQATGRNGIDVVDVGQFAGGITNSGTITAGSAGIHLNSGSLFSGGIVNSGTLVSDGYGLDISASTFLGGFVNSGTLNASYTAVLLANISTFAGGVTNSGTITTDSSAMVIRVITSFTGGIVNTGQIQSGTRVGIDITDVGLFSGGIINSGGIAASDTGIHLGTVSLFSGGIVNSGTIVSSGYGLRLSGMSTFMDGIVNSGIINSSYTAISLGGIAAFTGGITNSGTITSGSSAIRVNGGATFMGAIVNSGTITGVGSSIDVSAAPNAMTINQTAGALNGDIKLSPFADVLTVSGGAINGNIVGQGLTNIVNFDLGSGSFIYGPAYAITGVDQINVNSGFVTLNGTATATDVGINGGTLEVGDAAHPGASLLAANGITVATGGTLAGHGSVVADLAIPAGATLSPGGSIGTLNVNGNLSLAAGSFYHVEVNPVGDSSKTVATGTATIAGGTVQVTEQPGVYSPTTVYTILTANLGVTGTFDAATSDMLFLVPELAYDANNVFLSLSRNATFFADAALTSNQTGVGQALDASPLDSALLQPILTQTAAGARAAFDALSGEVHASLRGVLIDESRYMRQAMLGRVRQGAYADADDSGLAPLGFAESVASIPGSTTLSASAADLPVGAIPDAAPLFPSKLTFWSQAVGAWGTIDGDGNAAETHSDFRGFFTGVDARIGEAGRVGVVGGYTQSSTSVDERLSSADVDSGQIGVYAATRLYAFNLRAGAAYAFHDIETSRTIAFPGFLDTASADYDGDTGQIFGEIGYGIRLGQIAAEPFAGLAWVHGGTDGFAEDGGVAALDGADDGNGVGYSTLGIRVATSIMLDDGTTLVPRASLAWQHVFGDVASTADLAFQNTGTAFGVTGVPIARNAALVEAGVDMLISPDAKLGISYSGELAEDAQDHAMKGNLSWRF